MSRIAPATSSSQCGRDFAKCEFSRRKILRYIHIRQVFQKTGRQLRFSGSSEGLRENIRPAPYDILKDDGNRFRQAYQIVSAVMGRAEYQRMMIQHIQSPLER